MSSTFQLRATRQLPTLKVNFEEYVHVRTGAVHYHLATDNPENVFMVALRTVPMNSTGVAHILEHTALCGSRRFPVRDPFFMMIRRSMNTFMNAFTSSDWTAYPFASQNKKDFNNLLDVYMDAVFFSNLHQLDFAQEGHRLEFSEPTNPKSPLEFKGVVYNEMKGAMSSPSSYIWQQLSSVLFPTNTYHFNSGGEPSNIPDLSYEELCSFYRTHYHPSNAIFLTYGDIPAHDHHERFEHLALREFDKLDVFIEVADEQRYREPVKVTLSYPDDGDGENDKTQVLLAWLLGHSSNLQDLYEAQLLSAVLLDNSASPLQQVLETCGLGKSPSSLCGLEDSYKEMSFVCGLEGCATHATAAVEELILSTLERIASEGVPKAQIDAALHSLELHAREISGDSYPYGLQLLLSALSSATHRGNPVDLLDIDPALDKLKKACEQPDFIPSLIHRLLLKNPHRVTLTAHADEEFTNRSKQEEEQKLANIKSGLSDEDITNIIARSDALKTRQEQEPNAEILPKVELSDVPADIPWVYPTAHFRTGNQSGIELTTYERGTNGINYQQLILPLPTLSDDEASLLPYLTTCIPELGIGNRSYLDIQNEQAAVSGGVSCYSSMRSGTGDIQQTQGYLVLSSKGLYRNQEPLSRLLADTLMDCRFDEHNRILELIDQVNNRRQQSLSSQGHGLAMGLACSGMSALAQWDYNNTGLAGISRLKERARLLHQPDELARFAESLKCLYNSLRSQLPQGLLIAEADALPALLHAIRKVWPTIPYNQTKPKFTLPSIREPVQKAWLINAQVNFCAMAFPTVAGTHEDAAPLTVLAGFMRNGFLHRAIREQGGAYGGGATQDGSCAAFRFFSYRDPRLSETLADYRRAIDWMLTANHSDAQIEEAILGVISALDRPGSPAGAAKQSFHNELFGRTREDRMIFREQVLQVDLTRLKEVTQKYLKDAEASIGIVSHKGETKELESLGLEVNSFT